MFESLLNTFIVLLVVVDPIGIAPIFAALTQGATDQHRRRMALQGVLISAFILIAFTVAGQLLLRSLGITLDAFRVAGGFLLFLLSIDMVFARHSGLRSTTQSEQSEAEKRPDISVFPLAIPLIAGPGAMTTMLLLSGEKSGDWYLMGGTVLVLLVVLAITYFFLIFASRMIKLMGEIGANVVSRVLGVLLAALAIQYMMDGIRNAFFA